VSPKKRRGRPPTGRDPHVTARFPQTLVDQVEAWAARNDATRSEAIRRLVEMGLATTGPAPKRSNKRAALKAAELAGTMIDWLGDKSARPEEQAKRKRRLVKGPSEFREMRDDLPKAKPGR